jgi:Nif-specific regulatory protein/two-component system response regulator HydG
VNLDRMLARVLECDLDLERRLGLCVSLLQDATGAEHGFILLVEEGRWSFRVARGMDDRDIDADEFSLSRSIVDEAVRERRSVIASASDLERRPGGRDSIARLRLRSVLAVPLPHDGRVIGVLYLDVRRGERSFGEADRSLVEAFAARVAPLVAQSRAYSLQGEELRRTKRRLDKAVLELRRRYDLGALLGRTERMREVRRVVERAAELDVPILIHGETGTGKELVAQAIHAHSARAGGPMVVVNCASVAASLLESELFGHVRGAFSGATADRVGLVQSAEGGTLLLDEIGEMPVELQAKILRVLQFKEVRKVGSDRVEKVDVRILAATHRDLRARIKDGQFREDLYYRLNVVTVALPPLRDRREDIPDLARHFLAKFAQEAVRAEARLDDAAMEALARRDYPGNIRELENLLIRAAALCESGVIRATDVAPSSDGRSDARSPRTGDEYQARKAEAVDAAVDKVTVAFLHEVLSRAGGNVSRAAEEAGVNRSWLQTLATKHGVDPARYRGGQ